ncbi:MAG: 30S ribosomal protein S16 [bacterium]|nr:30S ribosomal protein S16 [bacterium]
MLVIRFFRVGKKNQPHFKIVVTEKSKPPRAGRFVEEVGFYNPIKKEKGLKSDRIKYWLSVGAKPSATVYNLLITEKIIEGKKIPKHKKIKVVEGIEKTAEAKPAIEQPAKKEKTEVPAVENKEEEIATESLAEKPVESVKQEAEPASE